ncbi:hypothetical protein BLA29_008957, partial [Euroglyphus maynei]
MIEGRILFNMTGTAIQHIFPALVGSLPDLDSNLKDFLVRMADSSYLQEKFAAMNPFYIAPKPFSLGNNKSYYYIPITELLIKYILNDDLIYSINQENSENVTPYVRSNGFYGKLRLVIYGDEFGVFNPLREASKKYKVYVLYLDVDNRKVTATKLKDIHLLLIWCPSDLKNSDKSLMDIFDPLCKDLNKLIANGISYVLNGQTIHIPVCVSNILGDNLSVAELLGLRRSFGRAFACRHCGIQHSELASLDARQRPLTIQRPFESYEKELNLVLSTRDYIS